MPGHRVPACRWAAVDLRATTAVERGERKLSDYGGEAPAVLLTNNDLRNVPTEFPVSNTVWQGQPRIRRRPTLIRPLPSRLPCCREAPDPA